MPPRLLADYIVEDGNVVDVEGGRAPYESDAQLAYLVKSGYADLVITEDSDLLLFGCKQVIFKLDLTGSGTLIAWSAGIGEKCCGIASQEFSPANLRFMGILSGCDYFPGIPRIGLATAAKVSVLALNQLKCSFEVIHFSFEFGSVWRSPLLCR
ncbi:unnamed protein product [Hydatigera taeniaeformis]|uniref:Exonuclease 1 n=1 Tax=Hydatigena taeniaeformis TaxID=6205 RepID=A0A0R3WM73_HYDTA|nr:unnamed protein product [Hydatigera taeniaeformis]